MSTDAAAFTSYQGLSAGLIYMLTSSPPSADGCRLRGKGVDSFCKTLMSKRENVGGGIDVAIVECTALHTPPFPYS